MWIGIFHLPVLFVLLTASVSGEVSFPGVEFNAAVGEPAHASSYYNYAPNVVHDTVFVPSNANDGFPAETSWWSAGDNASEQVFWQVNMSALVPTLSRIVVRWHGYMSPRGYHIRVSYDGIEFSSIIAVFNLSNAYDRVDNHTEGLSKITSKFKFLRVVMDDPNVCSDRYSCTDDGVSVTTSSTNERVLYGIREVEVWAKGTRNGTIKAFPKVSWELCNVDARSDVRCVSLDRRGIEKRKQRCGCCFCMVGVVLHGLTTSCGRGILSGNGEIQEDEEAKGWQFLFEQTRNSLTTHSMTLAPVQDAVEETLETIHDRGRRASESRDGSSKSASKYSKST
ncbi:hypothetical protein P3T76_012257 [Phytophthora citrophthora]|uniref:F5/8 type C domain-containing protein n=1 Tax=Phytophthora citrophthora TaxID=4793 RepID=A0AAD9G5K5_9STRA|nr:hypothetical protein P3T76_012257 [Phytophthora citrophthora]